MSNIKYHDVQKFDKNVTVATVTHKKLLDELTIKDWSDEILAVASGLNASKETGGSKPVLILNFAETDFVSSGASGKLIGLHRKLNEMGGKLIVANTEKTIGEALRVTNLNKIIKLDSGTVEELVQAAQEPARGY